MITIDYPVIISLIGAGLIGWTSGMISCYAVLKEQSLLGDAIAHAALPGICIAFLISQTKATGPLITGAIIAGILGVLFITTIIRKTFLKEDTALGIILSVFFGFGTLLLTMIQTIPTARQAGLDTYLFGNAAAMLKEDVIIIGGLSILITAVILIFWKEFKIIIFDPNHATTQGLPVIKLEILLTSLMVIAIVIGLQTVGVILMSAMIIAPAIAAKQWHNRLAPMMMSAMIIAITSCILGVLVSSTTNHLPTGPTIVIIISIIVFASLLLSPKGIISKQINRLRTKHNVQQNRILQHLYLMAQSHTDKTHPHNIRTLEVLGTYPSQKLLTQLKTNGLIYSAGENLWGLTKKGIETVTQLRQRMH